MPDSLESIGAFRTSVYVKNSNRSIKERVLKVKDYRNTAFVNLVVERRFYKRLKESAEELKIEPDLIINNVFFFVLIKLEQLAAKEKKQQRLRDLDIFLFLIGWTAEVVCIRIGFD